MKWEHTAVSLRSAPALIVGCFALLAIYFTGLFPPGKNPNELSRIQAIVAFVEDGTFSIDRQLSDFGSHEDRSYANGHYYSNKAPGLIFAGIPVYRALRVFLPRPHRATAPIFVLLRLFTVSLVSCLALRRFARFLERETRSAGSTALVVAALAFGTPFLFYARSFFSHAWSAALLFLALERIQEPGPDRRPWETALAGLLAGWAAISEYTVFPLAGLLALLAARNRGVSGLLWFCAGAAAPVILLLAYDSACFGSPWVLSSAREADPAYAELARHGLFGIRAPSARVGRALLFDGSRGVIVTSPIWLWAPWGFVRWWRSGRRRDVCLFAMASTALLFLVFAGYPNWEGGWCLGSRYLVPLLFVSGLALPYALTSTASQVAFAAAAVFSVGNHFLMTASYPYFPPSVPWPASTSLWFLQHGFVAANLGTVAGIPPRVSLLPPLLLVLLVLVVALGALSRLRLATWSAALAGLLLFAATLVPLPSLGRFETRWRSNMLAWLGPHPRSRAQP